MKIVELGSVDPTLGPLLIWSAVSLQSTTCLTDFLRSPILHIFRPQFIFYKRKQGDVCLSVSMWRVPTFFTFEERSEKNGPRKISSSS
jgi:hypothetical protein